MTWSTVSGAVGQKPDRRGCKIVVLGRGDVAVFTCDKPSSSPLVTCVVF